MSNQIASAALEKRDRIKEAFRIRRTAVILVVLWTSGKVTGE